MIELWDKDGEFTPDDEAIVVQLAQMAANAIETLELLAREHAARVEAEETGRRLLREKQRAEALQRVGSAIAGPAGPAGDRPARHRRRARADARVVRRLLLQRDLRRRRGVHALHALGRRAQRVRALPDAAQHRHLRADVQRRGDRPARRRARRPALRPQRALPRHAGGPPAGPQLPRGAGDDLRRRGRRRPVLRPPRARACSPPRTSTWSPGSPPSRRSRSRTRASTRSARAPPRRCSARCSRRTCRRSPGSSWPRATAPRARATRSAATSTTSSSRATGAGCWSSATSAARARRPPR